MLVATHRAADIPSDEFYLPIHVGHALHSTDLGYQPDDQGENISSSNESWCELTALYWAWRNHPVETIGLSHYRRYFKGSMPGPQGSSILSAEEANSILQSFDIVIGRRRNYVIESVDSHYRHAHHGEDLTILKSVIADRSPQMMPAYEAVFKGRSLSLYNMFVTRWHTFDSYASWLFPILQETTVRIDAMDTRTTYQRRTIGYLAERLLNVWIAGNPELKVARIPIINVDGENKIAKSINLLKRKSGLLDPHTRTA